MNSSLPSIVQEVLSGVPDWYEKQIKVLEESCAGLLGAPGVVEKTDNYCRSQIVSFCLDEKCRFVEPTAEFRYRVKLFICDSGPLFCFAVTENVARDHWTGEGTPHPEVVMVPVPDRDAPSEILQFLKTASGILETRGLTRVQGPILQQIVEGHVTELENKPATLFEVLFSETD